MPWPVRKKKHRDDDEDGKEIETNLGNTFLSTNITTEEIEMKIEDLTEETNEIEILVEVIDDRSNPDSALSGFYSDCLLSLSFLCVQRKMLVYINRLNRKNYLIISHLSD